MRKKRVYKKHYQPDARHSNVAVGRFINYLMEDGKKSVAERVLYDAMRLFHRFSHNTRNGGLGEIIVVRRKNN